MQWSSYALADMYVINSPYTQGCLGAEAGVMKHNGRWNACGNPSGRARCRAAGNCSWACNNCGAGTQWPCCGCPDASSTYCLAGTTRAQAEHNVNTCWVEWTASGAKPSYVISKLVVAQGGGAGTDFEAGSAGPVVVTTGCQGCRS